jgi:ribulose-phosphate 3-epimerase
MMRQFILSPSLLSSDFGALRAELTALEDAGLKWVHWDVMDGAFVPNITFGPPIIKRLRKTSKLFFDVHLMIERPERYIREFADAGADLLCIHAESTLHLERTERHPRGGHADGTVPQPGHAPEHRRVPAAPAGHGADHERQPRLWRPVLHPLLQGQDRNPLRHDPLTRPQTLIQVDGGVTLDNAKELFDLGADVLVSGSAFFGFPPYAERHRAFQDTIHG